MYLFKTSGETFNNVITHQKHAFRGMPQDWYQGEIVLVSKNQSDLDRGEKQTSYIMKISNIRRLRPGEADRYWPGNEGRWKYLVECYDTKQLAIPFNLREIVGRNAQRYGPVQSFTKIRTNDEQRIMEFINRN